MFKLLIPQVPQWAWDFLTKKSYVSLQIILQIPGLAKTYPLNTVTKKKYLKASTNKMGDYKRKGCFSLVTTLLRERCYADLFRWKHRNMQMLSIARAYFYCYAFFLQTINTLCYYEQNLVSTCVGWVEKLQSLSKKSNSEEWKKITRWSQLTVKKCILFVYLHKLWWNCCHTKKSL